MDPRHGETRPLRTMFTMSTWLGFLLLIMDVSGGTYTTFVTMEKLFVLEEELISISDIVLLHEKNLHIQDDVHNIYDIADTVNMAKEIHRQIPVDNLTSYISHPINIFHLTKRLVRNWTDIVGQLGESRTCAKYMHSKIQNIQDNLPTEDQLASVAQALVKLQSLYDLPVEQMLEGSIENESALSPLSLDDAFDLARAAHANNDFFNAVTWLKYVTSRFGEADVTYSKINALSLLSSSYFMLNRHKEALATLDSILKIDPENELAQRNRKFMAERMPENSEDLAGKPLTKPALQNKRDQMAAEICASSRKPQNASSQWMRCMMMTSRNDDIFSRPNIRMEILHYRPFIVLFHNVTNATVQEYVYELGYEKMRHWMYNKWYRYPGGLETLELRDLTANQSIPRLKEELLRIPLSEDPQETNFIIHNTGMEGYRWRDNIRATPYRYRLGTYLVFLSNSTHGGEVVFPSTGVKVAPVSGSVLFWDRKAHPEAAICPVKLGAQWVGTFPLYEEYRSNICSRHLLWKPKKADL